MKKKIIIANEAGKTRLRAVEMVQAGKNSLAAIARHFNIHTTTLTEWCKMYEEGGVERLCAPLKPRTKHQLDAVELETAIEHCDEKYHARLRRLVRLANGERLKDLAESEGVSVQYIMKDRRDWEQGKLPPTIQI